MRNINSEKAEAMEVDLLLELVNKLSGYDFRHYSREFVLRRSKEIAQRKKLPHISNLFPLLLHEKNFLGEFLAAMPITVTQFFRDPDFFYSYYTRVIPYLTTFPYIKVWHAGCSTGQEVYSHAILLHQAELSDRSMLYGTDFNLEALKKASSAIYPISELRGAEVAYQKAGGLTCISDYYHNAYNLGKISATLRRRVTFSHHNLECDGIFGEMNVIFCRNTLIYFDHFLQNKVLKLFLESLRPGGYLCLGDKESITFFEYKDAFEAVDGKNRIFRKKLV